MLDDIQFFRSIDEFIASEAHTAYRVDEVEADGNKIRYGGGLIGGYELPFSGVLAFGVEAAWFSDDDAEAHSFIWQMILNEAVDAGFSSLCVKPETTTHPPRMPQRDHRSSDFGVHRDVHTLLRAPKPGLWSAFLGPNPQQPRFVDCLRVVPKIQIDVRGTVYDGDGLLYRGEGRIDSGPYVTCKTLEEVAHRAFTQGFCTRGRQALFRHALGTDTSSGLHSFRDGLIDSFGRGCRPLRNSRGQSREQALVFVLDPAQIRQSGAIWDSFASMTRSAGRGWLATDFNIVVKLASGLGTCKKPAESLRVLPQG